MSQDRDRSAPVHEWLRTIAVLLTPVVVALLGANYTSRSAARETDAKLIQLAVDILNASPTDSTRALRSWAIEIIDHHADVKFSPLLQAQLKDSISLKARASVMWSATGGFVNASGLYVATEPGRHRVIACNEQLTVCDTSFFVNKVPEKSK